MINSSAGEYTSEYTLQMSTEADFLTVLLASTDARLLLKRRGLN